MKVSLLILSIAMIAYACSTSLPAPTPAAEGGTASTSADARGLRRSHPSAPSAPDIADPRTPKEIALAACPAGRCVGTDVKPKLSAATSVPVTPTSWTVPNWYIDSANSSGCASNSSSGTAATCTGGCSGSSCPSGVGPLSTVTEITTHRWGTVSPILPQTTTLHVLSAQTIGQERIVLSPTMVANSGGTPSNFVVLGTNTAVGSTFASGTVTAKSRGTPGTLLKIATIPGGAAAGMLVFNSTRSSWATIDSIAAGTATLTQPLSNAVLTTVTAVPNFVGSEVDTWATSDTLQLFSEPLLNLTAFFPTSGDSNSAITTPTAWLQNLYIPDVSGTVGGSATTIKLYGPGATLSNCRFDTFLTYDGADQPYGAFSANTWLNGGLDFVTANMVAGASNTSNTANEFSVFENIASFDGDAILHGGVLLKGAYSTCGFAYCDSVVAAVHGGVLLLGPELVSTTTSQLWGSGSVNLEGPNSAVQLEVGLGQSWTGSLTVNSLSIEGIGTGSSYASGTWTDGVSITPGNLDAHNGLQNPRTGNRYSGT